MQNDSFLGNFFQPGFNPCELGGEDEVLVRLLPRLMDAATLRACKRLTPLSEADRRKLDQLMVGDLPPGLRALAQAQYDLSATAEQEQYL